MAIKEVWALIATLKNEKVKRAYLFSCFFGLRVSDVLGLKWKDVFTDRGQKPQESASDLHFILPAIPYATMMLTLGAALLLCHANVKIAQVYAKIINQNKDNAVNWGKGLFD